MPTSLTFEEYGDGIGRAATVLRANAGATPLDAAVPTCPEWDVRDLVAHQGMVHRWATATVAQDPALDPDAARAEGLASPDLLGWFDAGATALLQALASAPPDLDVWFVVKDAGPAREAWARRQSHETTIHAVDAIAARLGRVPLAEETWIGAEHAVDGIDELLHRFLPRSRTPLRHAEGMTVLVAPDGTDARWTVELSPERPRVSDGAPARPDVTLSGSPAQLYLGLWNRGEEISVEGDPAFVARWRDTMKITF